MGCPSPTPCPLVHTPPRPHRPTSPLNTATLESTSPSNSSRKDTYSSISSGLLTLRNNQSKQLTNWDQETVKRHKWLPAKNPASNWEQKKCSRKFVLLTLLVFTLCLFGFSYRLYSLMMMYFCLSLGHAYDCGHRVQCF